jgi:CAAX prenyl protease-like protein
MALFLLLTTLEGYAPRSYYVGLYVLKVCLVTAGCSSSATPGGGRSGSTARAAARRRRRLGVFAEWVLIDKWVPYPHLGGRSAFNPFAAIGDPMLRTLFLAARFYGLVLLVPVMEELFWRSFLLRYATDPDFRKLPVGAFSWTAFAIVAVMFGAAHPEWLVAVIAACAYALLLRQTRSLFACIVAHGVTNLALGVYVLATGDWKYW